MGLDLDLAESRTKLTRATVHLDTLQLEATAAFQEAGAYQGRLGKSDENGWYPILIAPKTIAQETQRNLSAIFGDVLHNFRSALDYIVSSLAIASGADIETSHQFPTFDDPAEFATKVWRKGSQLGSGQLRNVKYGLAEIEALQPYHVKPVKEASTLWQINRFSNHDKHRSMAAQFPTPGWGLLGMNFGDAEPIGFRHLPQGDIEANTDTAFAAVRFASAPDMAEVDMEGYLATDLWFTVGPNKRDKLWRGIRLCNLDRHCRKVESVIGIFERL